MKVLKFNLSGEFAFFKNEIINDMYDTYPHIHRPALLGLLGAVLGYGGYAQTHKVFGNEDNSYPEYYKKLKDLKITVVPMKYNFSKKLETFTNSTAMFNRNSETKKGTNLIVEQFWLENPSWDIYIALDSDEAEKIKDSIINHKTVYNTYLGANNHFAVIDKIGLFEAEEISTDDFIINSLIKVEDVDTSKMKETMVGARKREMNIFYFSYILPTELTENTNIYIKKSFVLTNEILHLRKGKGYKIDDVNVVFY